MRGGRESSGIPRSGSLSGFAMSTATLAGSPSSGTTFGGDVCSSARCLCRCSTIPVVAFAGPAKPIGKHVMRLQLAEYPRALTHPAAQDARHRQPGVVVEDRARHLAEKTKRRVVSVAERFGGFLRIGPHKTSVAVRQLHRKKVDLAFDPRDLCQGLAKIHLRMTGIVLQRYKHLALLQTSPPNVVPDDGDPARVAVLIAKPLKDPLRGMPLLSRPPLIRHQDPVDDPGKGVQLRARRRPPP